MSSDKLPITYMDILSGVVSPQHTCMVSETSGIPRLPVVKAFPHNILVTLTISWLHCVGYRIALRCSVKPIPGQCLLSWVAQIQVGNCYSQPQDAAASTMWIK